MASIKKAYLIVECMLHTLLLALWTYSTLGTSQSNFFLKGNKYLLGLLNCTAGEFMNKPLLWALSSE